MEKDGLQRWLPLLVGAFALLVALPGSVVSVLQLRAQEATVTGTLLMLYQLATPAISLAILVGIYWHVRPKTTTWWRIRHGMRLCRVHEAALLQTALERGLVEARWDRRGLRLLLDFGILRLQSRQDAAYAVYDPNPKARRMARRLVREYNAPKG